jgi:hypothetical protein
MNLDRRDHDTQEVEGRFFLGKSNTEALRHEPIASQAVACVRTNYRVHAKKCLLCHTYSSVSGKDPEC